MVSIKLMSRTFPAKTEIGRLTNQTCILTWNIFDPTSHCPFNGVVFTLVWCKQSEGNAWSMVAQNQRVILYWFDHGWMFYTHDFKLNTVISWHCLQPSGFLSFQNYLTTNLQLLWFYNSPSKRSQLHQQRAFNLFPQFKLNNSSQINWT